MKICDLHTHSIYSDGTFSPKEIIDSAVNIGLEAVALCDHNTVDGLPEFLAAAENKSIQAIAGAEFSVDYNGKELHLLGLFIPESAFGTVSELMEDVNEKKRQSNIALIASLNRAGYEIDYEEVKKLTPDGKFNRAHIAEELTRKGYTESIDQAFKTLLSKKAGYYVEPQRIPFFDMIEFIKSVGAVPVLAHPFLDLNKDELEILLPLAKSRGLAGMECYYSKYTEEQTSDALELTERFGLKFSGGSDFHGSRKPDIMLGTGKGNLKIPYDWVAELETCK
ncbi:MAG: PHP domain-containing protein [Clostridia bacterium]|nr:PHP domain-containing protein [Clostridia bacterium]